MITFTNDVGGNMRVEDRFAIGKTVPILDQ